MFKHLKFVKCKFGDYWDESDYHKSLVPNYISQIGESGRVLLATDGESELQILRNALVRQIDIDFSRKESGVDNEAKITVVFESDEFQIVATYIGVNSFCFGQRCLGFSAIPEIHVHELVVDEGLIEHRVLCHGADAPFFVRCQDLQAIRETRN